MLEIHRVGTSIPTVGNNPLRFTDPTGQACVGNGSGGFVDDNNGGQSCAEVTEADKNLQPSVTVTAAAGNVVTAAAINLFIAVDNIANDAFRFISPDSQLLSNTPTSQGTIGQVATAVAVVGTAVIGPGGEAGKVVNITKAGLEHALERHAVGGIKSAGKSLFHAGENIQSLVKAAESVSPVKQAGGKP